MARINKKVKLFIVKMLAEFETTTETAKAVKKIFNVDVSQQQCECYDPTKKMGHDLSEELRRLFFEYRRMANDKLEAIPIANKRYRLQLLQGLVDKYPDNPVLIPKWAEQAAKEMGGLYTNRQEITGANGGAIQTENSLKGQQPTLTPDELANLTPQELSRLAINGKL
ncbi:MULTISPECIES: DUF2280 domain-containing protein [unclassified Acinetobacter]|uniref:DUF2280 domain-containing protein n=1 Tax=unclassified Acinetobacter TaxID=196816 RepID=UPI002446EDF0|nr:MULTISPECIES: DUF2280 domain-containing protein [unclassified Acinetobacter]MDH0030331.1 DUF2280 domain-containing protein [Acinetobacter sp. GD04021]MDH0885899.1 DUF2280 domain-containing protein [Acinetobacter sp. GD03873]MDH1082519.1 DUF2280 domain-containing protein [Acinetobacter sp. GD03983]MDH2189089.1 DUF2280 domain-containing protein [Acinetobacter sp. GD03645]MDH2202277.1 DUF2280 domain-containing protein [Acinetobacter sp. GD03647]